MRIDCLEAFDGGLQQTFGLELRDAGKRGHQVLYSLNSSRPTFTVYGLQPETAFLLSVFALNAKGRSHEVVLEAATLSMPEKHTGTILAHLFTFPLAFEGLKVRLKEKYGKYFLPLGLIQFSFQTIPRKSIRNFFLVELYRVPVVATGLVPRGRKVSFDLAFFAHSYFSP